ncbi:MAG TPA: sigma-70 family RNA polymerase sigma factor [Candidatus Kapabacteria bacterium]|nr:sigma-70 family RNA polymerase sigma factor [Candidatus Kapabacteria bacterium]
MTTTAIRSDATERSQSDLLVRVAGQDRAALEALYDAFERPVYGLIVGIVRETDEAEDIMQEVFAQIWRKASQYHPALGSARNWILRIAHNMSINAIRSQSSRSRKQQVGIEAVENRASTDPLLSDVVSLTEEVAQLNAALARLPKEQRDLITLAFLQGLSHAEIAQQTAIPLGTVKTRIRSGLIQLRSQLRHITPDHLSARQSNRSTSL